MTSTPRSYEGKGHIKRNGNVGFVYKCSSVQVSIKTGITISGKLNNLTLMIKVIQKSSSNSV